MASKEFELAAFRYFADHIENQAIWLFVKDPKKFGRILETLGKAVADLDRESVDLPLAQRCADSYVPCIGGICVPPGTPCPKPNPRAWDEVRNLGKGLELTTFRFAANHLEKQAIRLFAGTPLKYGRITEILGEVVTKLDREWEGSEPAS